MLAYPGTRVKCLRPPIFRRDYGLRFVPEPRRRKTRRNLKGQLRHTGCTWRIGGRHAREPNFDQRGSRLTMSNHEDEKSVQTTRSIAALHHAAAPEDPLADTRQLIAQDAPHGVDRRRFLMRAAVGGAAAVMTGCSGTPEQRT